MTTRESFHEPRRDYVQILVPPGTKICGARFMDPMRDFEIEEATQKTPGVFALHMLCKSLLRDMHTGRRPWTQEHFAEMLADSEELGMPSYWAVGTDERNRGEGAKYGSMKGFAELADLLRQGLQG